MSEKRSHALVEGVLLLCIRKTHSIDCKANLKKHTNINASQSGEIQSSTNDIRSSLREYDMPAIVAFLHRFQDIIRIVCLEIIVALDNAFLGPFRRSMHLLVRALGRVDQRGPAAFVCLHACVVGLDIFLVCSPSGKGASGLEEP